MTREIIIEPGATTGKQYDFEYDLCGNILSKTESTYTVATGAITGSTTKQYAYNDGTWKDLLSAYGTRYFTYDEIGNLRSIKNGSNTSGYYFNWGKGRQLESLTYGETAESAALHFEYGYNADGIRISKAILGRKLEYIVDGDKILKQVGCGVGVLQTLEFYYDALGEIIGFNYANQDYYFGKNLQGDVVELYQDGTLIATYEYDAWGKLLSIKDANGVTIADDINSRHVASINPIRYRGYYYDLEKKMYYLNSRYYYPEIGRFISADSVIAGVGGSMQGYNMFAYCFNNPVNMSDSSGHWPQWMKGAANWVNNNIIQPVANFFSPTTNTISGQFQDGIFRGSGSLTGGYSEFNWRLDDKIKSSGSQDGWVGGFGKASVGNANGKIGIGNDNLSASLKGVADGLVATTQAGLHYKDGFGVGAKAKASVLSGRATTEFNIFGWQVELGVSGDVLSVGAEATIGIFPTDDGGKQFDARYNVGAGWFGWGYVVRVKAPA